MLLTSLQMTTNWSNVLPGSCGQPKQSMCTVQMDKEELISLYRSVSALTICIKSRFLQITIFSLEFGESPEGFKIVSLLYSYSWILVIWVQISEVSVHLLSEFCFLSSNKALEDCNCRKFSRIDCCLFLFKFWLDFMPHSHYGLFPLNGLCSRFDSRVWHAVIA